MIALLVFWPLGVLGIIAGGVLVLVGPLLGKIDKVVAYCEACHKQLPSPDVTVCIACGTRFDGVDVRPFATMEEAAKARQQFGGRT